MEPICLEINDRVYCTVTGYSGIILGIEYYEDPELDLYIVKEDQTGEVNYYWYYQLIKVPK